MFDGRLKKFISNYSKNTSFNSQTILNGDFFDDNVEFLSFIRVFSAEFDIDISNFDYSKYTDATTSNTEKEYLTIGDLEKAISLGSLDECTIASEEFEANFRPDITPKSIVLGIIVALLATALLCLVAVFS